MSLAFAHPRQNPAFAAVHARLSRTLSAPAPRRIETGELIALPILTAPDGGPLDLEVIAAGQPATFLFLTDRVDCRSESVDALLAVARTLAAARSAVLIVVVPTRSAAVPCDAVVAVDPGLRFAHVLGLEDVLSGDRAEPGAAFLAVNEVGCVTRIEVDRAAR